MLRFSIYEKRKKNGETGNKCELPWFHHFYFNKLLLHLFCIIQKLCETYIS